MMSGREPIRLPLCLLASSPSGLKDIHAPVWAKKTVVGVCLRNEKRPSSGTSNAVVTRYEDSTDGTRWPKEWMMVVERDAYVDPDAVANLGDVVGGEGSAALTPVFQPYRNERR